MKKKNRTIILIIIGVLISLFFYAKHNFENDKQTLLKIKSKAGFGEIKYAFDKMEEIESLSNPLINFAYQKWKKKMYARFILKEEIIENTSNNKIINDISNIYREYWRTELLKNNQKDRTDSILYKNLTNYISTNQLSTLSKDSLSKSIKNDSELKKIFNNEGFKSKFMYRNGFQDLLLWNKESIKKYKVILPKDTINTKVIFIENYNLKGYDSYATFNSSEPGGWALKESATLYCNKGEYNLTSEKFKISYLKHESLHFTDLNKYLNLSATDLEYRSKLIELMYCTNKTIYDRIAEFINGASNANRNHSHPYANYSLIKNLSKLLFNSEYETNYKNWKELSVENINNAAVYLYEKSEESLQENNNLTNII